MIFVLKKDVITLAQALATNSFGSKEILETWIPLGDQLGEYRSGVSRTR